jgi:hypothetical protein
MILINQDSSSQLGELSFLRRKTPHLKRVFSEEDLSSERTT